MTSANLRRAQHMYERAEQRSDIAERRARILLAERDAAVGRQSEAAAAAADEAAAGTSDFGAVRDEIEREHAPRACVHMCILMCMACALHVYRCGCRKRRRT